MNKLVLSMGLLMMASVVNAQPGPDSVQINDTRGVREERIQFGDLNLTNSVAITTLYARIANAAKHVCGDSDGKNLQVWAQERKCKGEAIRLAVHRVNHSALTAYWAKTVAGKDRAQLAQTE